MNFAKHYLVTTLLASLSIGSAFANGNHAGGHGHDDEEKIGQAGNMKDVKRTITVDMSDAMRFTPANITAKQGETIRFLISNSGKIKHELVLGTEKELKEHYEIMKKNPEMEHSDPNQITLAPGGKGEIIWKFTQAGKIDFACLQPGHYDAGMKGQVNVAKSAAIKEAHDHKHE